MELLPLGPVVFIDTAGIDDEGALGELRIARTRRVLDRTDLGIVVSGGGDWGSFEEGLVAELQDRKVGVLVVFNKVDTTATQELPRRLQAAGSPCVHLGDHWRGYPRLAAALLATAPEDFFDARPSLGDLVDPGELAVLVVPIDKEAPKGRLILPQVQTIRDLLDTDAFCMVVKERELRDALDRLQPAARPGGHRLPGLPEGGRRHAARACP